MKKSGKRLQQKKSGEMLDKTYKGEVNMVKRKSCDAEKKPQDKKYYLQLKQSLFIQIILL